MPMISLVQLEIIGLYWYILLKYTIHITYAAMKDVNFFSALKVAGKSSSLLLNKFKDSRLDKFEISSGNSVLKKKMENGEWTIKTKNEGGIL